MSESHASPRWSIACLTPALPRRRAIPGRRLHVGQRDGTRASGAIVSPLSRQRNPRGGISPAARLGAVQAARWQDEIPREGRYVE